MINCLIGLVFCSLVFQVSAMETIEFDNSTDIELKEENRFLFNNILASKCRTSINRGSTVLPGVTITLTRLSNNRLYYFSPPVPAPAMLVSFEQARTFCTDHGMHLVILNTAKENTLVYMKAIELGLAGGAATPGAWIGLRDISGIPNFQWVSPGANPVLNFFGAPGLANECASYTAAPAIPPATSWLAVGLGCVGPLAFICELEPPCSLVL